MMRTLGASSLGGLLLAAATPVTAADDSGLPRFSVPGFEREMAALNELHALHHEGAFTPCTLWDAWLPMATLWASNQKRTQYRGALLNRPIDSEGHVSMQQHRGLAHPAGWPFPTWHQTGGIGFHYTHHNDPYSIQLKVPLAGIDTLTPAGIATQQIDPARGLVLSTEGQASSLTSPEFRIDTFLSPFIVVEWSGIEPGMRPILQWTTENAPGYDEERRMEISLENARPGNPLTVSVIPVHRHPDWKGHLTGLRLHWINGETPGNVVLRSIHTAVDSRHPITGSLFVRGCCDYFNWTRDLDFLRTNLPRMRLAIDYAIREFAIEDHGCVLVPWVGHGGRTGFVHDADGNKEILFGRGIGNNYYDLLPFGHKDGYATVHLFDALRAMEKLEDAVAARPEWELPPPASERTADDLRVLANQLRDTGRKLFWDNSKKRFVACIDIDGKSHDYGFTFLNLDAIHYGFASDAQATAILDWLCGDRTVAGDTSTGPDIYHWRFAPRATTLRNIDWYSFVWHGPDTIPWGGQVQDGGAVLGFSFQDIMSRLRTRGPDDAWARLRGILHWFEEVRDEGGYRAFYAKQGRGSLQGGGTPGGLGLDHEFLESVLVPQVMLYGFLGFEATPEGYSLNPRLPGDWPSLTITGIRFHDQVLDITAHRDGRVEVVTSQP